MLSFLVNWALTSAVSIMALTLSVPKIG